MLQTIKEVLLKIVDDIDDTDAAKILKALREYTRKDVPMSKYQAYTYLGISRATFDNLVSAGKLPPGKKVPGFKEKAWYKKDLKIHD